MVSKRELVASLLAFTRSFNFVNSRLSSSDVAQPMDAADWMETFFLPDGPSCNSSAAQPAVRLPAMAACAQAEPVLWAFSNAMPAVLRREDF